MLQFQYFLQKAPIAIDETALPRVSSPYPGNMIYSSAPVFRKENNKR